MSQHAVVGGVCDQCNTCCGGTCGRVFIQPRQTGYKPVTASVLFLGSLDFSAGWPIAQQTSTMKYGKFDPDATDGLEVPIGIAAQAVYTDSNGNLINFKNALTFVGGCGFQTGEIWTAGDFLPADIADGDAEILAALLAFPNFAKRVDNGYIRIL